MCEYIIFYVCVCLSYRLVTIDESASILSDISYDKTDDSLVSSLFSSPSPRIKVMMLISSVLNLTSCLLMFGRTGTPPR